MKKKISIVLAGILFLAGLSLLLYPLVANQWNNYRQSRLISEYESVVKDESRKGTINYEKEWERADAYNQSLLPSILPDSFAIAAASDKPGEEYMSCLNILTDEMMGYVEVPKINIKLAIYHGTAEDVLQTGIGHMNGTSLPIGGESTHSVLAAHRGLPAARLFTDIDQLKQGDMFYIHVLDETMAYQVDQILDMVDKDDHETLEEALQIQEGEDQVTLFTCTPYGVNSHRLLVRGTRVPYNGEEKVESTPVDSMLRAIQNYYMLYLILGLAVTLLVILIMKFLFDRKNKKRSGKTDDMSKEG